MKKSTHPLMQILVLLALALACFLIASIATALMAFTDVDIQSRSFLLWTQSLTSILIFVVPMLLMVAIYYRKNAVSFLALRADGHSWLMALVGIVVLLLITPLNEWLTEWNDTWNLGHLGEMLRQIQEQSEGVMEKLIKGDTIGALLANLLVIAVLPAVCEELFFRGGIQNLLQRWVRNPHVAIWITAAVFSLIHGEIFSFVPRFVLGALLGYLYVYGGSMVVNVVAHFVNNAVVVLLYWLVARGTLDLDPEAPLGFTPVITVCCTLAAVAVMWVTFSGKKVKKLTV